MYDNGRKIDDGYVRLRGYPEWPLPEMALFGARMRRGRTRAGLSQRALAERAGVSQSSVSRLERGIALGFTAIRLVAIATALGPSFPFGHCPHDDKCGLPFDPRQDKRTFWELLNG